MQQTKAVVVSKKTQKTSSFGKFGDQIPSNYPQTIRQPEIHCYQITAKKRKRASKKKPEERQTPKKNQRKRSKKKLAEVSSSSL